MANTKEVNKPITIVVDDFKVALTELINGSMLPPFIVEAILKEMYLETKAVARKKLEEDRKNYELELGNKS